MSDLIRKRKRAPFCQVCLSLPDNTELSYSTTLYVALKKYEDWKDNTCFPSYAALTERTGLSKNTIKKALRDLEKAGYLEVEVRASSKKSNIYTLLDGPIHGSNGDPSEVHGSNGDRHGSGGDPSMGQEVTTNIDVINLDIINVEKPKQVLTLPQREDLFTKEVQQIFYDKGYPEVEFKKFINYYTASDGKKMLWEKKKKSNHNIFDVPRTIGTWMGKAKEWNKSSNDKYDNYHENKRVIAQMEHVALQPLDQPLNQIEAY